MDLNLYKGEIEMTRLRKIKERRLKRLAAVQNMDSPFSDKECLNIYNISFP